MATSGVAAAIEELRQELYQAQALGASQQFAFGVEEAELELQLELRKSAKGDGKLSFGVVAVGAGGERSTVRTHKLTLKLSVKDRALGGASLEIGDDESGSLDED
ncbi:trypco2 family protein [Streptomyces rishiriensis]|uniref:trypco2 family protein n=1 Tax=Streptomyces rishiriensis TaxID=68264 RepID=UPI000D5A1262|nr:trypco2 family protein [Streptomyces rishiriensis]